MVKHTQTIRRPLPTNCLSVFDHSVGLALKELSYSIKNFSLTSISSQFFYSELRNYLDNFIFLIVTLIPFIITKPATLVMFFLQFHFQRGHPRMAGHPSLAYRRIHIQTVLTGSSCRPINRIFVHVYL